MTEQEFTEKFPAGTIISFIEGKQYIRSGARVIFKITRYETNPKGFYFMYGVWCGFEFNSTNYSKEYSLTDTAKWHCIDCTSVCDGTALGTLLHKFNDVRTANEVEKRIFYSCI